MDFHLIFLRLFFHDEIKDFDLFLNWILFVLLWIKSMVLDSFVEVLLEIFTEMVMGHVFQEFLCLWLEILSFSNSFGCPFLLTLLLLSIYGFVWLGDGFIISFFFEQNWNLFIDGNFRVEFFRNHFFNFHEWVKGGFLFAKLFIFDNFRCFLDTWDSD